MKHLQIFFETIKIENSKIYHLEFHQKRLEKTIWENFEIKTDINLSKIIKPPKYGLFRCKVIYDKEVLKIEYHRYKIREFKNFKLIKTNIQYPYKYFCRNEIDRLFMQKELSDDILIIENSFIKDTSIANIALLIDGVWLTPEYPLLKGTCRERLLKERRIFVKKLTIDDLKRAEKFAILNAMVGFYIIKDVSFNFDAII